MNRVFPPSPIPPYHRPVRSIPANTVTAAGTLALDPQVTYLDKTGDVTVEVTIPAGTYQRQWHRLFIPKDNEQTTASFIVRGTFPGFHALLFNKIATAAQLVWDGSGWHVVGGNVDEHHDIEPPPIPEDPGPDATVRIKDGIMQMKADDGLWYDTVLRRVGGALGSVQIQIEGEGEEI